MRKLLSFLFGFCVLVTAPARALDIQLISGDWQPINIHVELFPGEEKLQGQMPSDIISNDLSVSGHFFVRKEEQNTYGNISPERLNTVRQRGGEYLLTGQVQNNGSDHTLLFSLHDALTGDSIGSYSVGFGSDNKRLVAHNVSNWIYEEIIGKPGVFHTKVAYVLRRPDGSNQLKVADYDGYNRLAILSSDDNIISPAWSHDGNELLYVSFEQNKPVIYSQSLLTGRREIVANFKGSNSAPAMAPDNRTIAAALTEHGGLQQIYLLADERKSRLREIDDPNIINTEPAFSPDGKRIAYTSDEKGSPQIYEYNLDSKENERLTYGSSYNVSPDYASDGKVLALIRRDGNGDNVALLDIRSKATSALTKIRLADSPSFSPNDDIIAFIDETNKKYLATVSINGKVTMFWQDGEEGNIVDPAWSPIKSNWF